MGSGTFVDDFKQGLEFTPVEGSSNLYSIRPHRDEAVATEREMTPAEWNKFEKDIADAFERVP